MRKHNAVESRVFVLHDENGPIWLKADNRYAAPRPSKRVYFREQDAKSGIKNLPYYDKPYYDKSSVRIVEYAPVDNRWDSLKTFIQSEMDRHDSHHEDHICCALEDVLNAMDKLERGESLE